MMELVILVLTFVAAVSSQAASQIEFSTADPKQMQAGVFCWWEWTGGDGSSIVTFTLMQGCDKSHLTLVAVMGTFDPSVPGQSAGLYYVPPSTFVNGVYWVQLSQTGSLPVYTTVTYYGGGQPKSSATSCTNTASAQDATTSTQGSSTTTSVAAISQTLTSSFSTSSTSSHTSSTNSHSTQPAVGNTEPGAKILTGSCTSPIFAYATAGVGGNVPYEYPVIGCAGGRPECCPYQLQTSALPGSSDYGISDSAISSIEECPGDYTSVATGKTSGVNICCPKGWLYNSININSLSVCYSSISPPLQSPFPITITFNGNPSYVIQEIIVSTVFAAALQQSIGTSAPPTDNKALSQGEIAGIAIGVVAVLATTAIILWLCIRRSRRAGNRRQNELGDHGMPPDYPVGEMKTGKPDIIPTAVEGDVPGSPISLSDSGMRRKAVPYSLALNLSSVEEQAVALAAVEALRAENVERARRRRASELEESTRQHRASELEENIRHELDNNSHVHEVPGE